MGAVGGALKYKFTSPLQPCPRTPVPAVRSERPPNTAPPAPHGPACAGQLPTDPGGPGSECACGHSMLPPAPLHHLGQLAKAYAIC